MSNSAQAATKTRIRVTAKKNKVRQNISIDPVINRKAKRLALIDGLSFSTWIEQMLRERIAKSEEVAK